MSNKTQEQEQKRANDQNFGEEGSGSNLWTTKEEQTQQGLENARNQRPGGGTAQAGSPHPVNTSMSEGGGDVDRDMGEETMQGPGSQQPTRAASEGGASRGGNIEPAEGPRDQFGATEGENQGERGGRGS